MKYTLAICAFLTALFAACNQPAVLPFAGRILYSTNDSAYYYYQLGWQQIMDEGRYGEAEVSYRKALHFDPDFLVGKATLGRLTLDTAERIRIEKELTGISPALPADELALLQVYTDFVRYTNIRERQPEKAPEVLSEILRSGQKEFRELINKYPEEIYIKCEYVELVHSIQGVNAALDTLSSITHIGHAENWFLTGFRASLEAEAENYEKALEIAGHLDQMIVEDDFPKQWVVYADIYFKMDSLNKAKVSADKAVSFDSRNLDAFRLKQKIDARLLNRQ